MESTIAQMLETIAKLRTATPDRELLRHLLDAADALGCSVDRILEMKTEEDAIADSYDDAAENKQTIEQSFRVDSKGIVW